MPNALFVGPNSTPQFMLKAFYYISNFINVTSASPTEVTGTFAEGSFGAHWDLTVTGSGLTTGPGFVLGHDFILSGIADAITITFSPGFPNDPVTVEMTDLGMDMAELYAAALAQLSGSAQAVNVFVGGFDWNLTMNGTDDFLNEIYVNLYLANFRGDDTIRANGGDDDLFAGDGDDLVFGGNGKDTLSGGIGNDQIDGGDKDDVLKGDAGRDVIKGGSGKDTITGGLGADRLSGGTKADVFVFVAGDGDDTIKDFKDGLDKLDFHDAGSFSFGESARGWALVEYGTSQVELIGVDVADLSIRDFI